MDSPACQLNLVRQDVGHPPHHRNSHQPPSYAQLAHAVVHVAVPLWVAPAEEEEGAVEAPAGPAMGLIEAVAEAVPGTVGGEQLLTGGSPR